MPSVEQAGQKIRAFYQTQRRMPSFAEVAKLFNYASKMSAHRLIEKLVQKKILLKDKKGKLIATPSIALPLLGHVQAGFPSAASEELIDTLSLDEYLIRNPDQSFMLKVTGDSMIDAGIHPGDIIIIEKGKQPQNENIVLAQVDREWTLKYFIKNKDGSVFLRAANSRYKDIHPKEELSLGGVVKAVIRRYS
ncbi:MAG: LexA family transcriptional regulator [Deltaproteobacteria bacterium]|nr:LexA family transcriptional regulator [Deltaproteobacteria bacterium]